MWGTGCHQNTTAKPATVLDVRVADVGVPDKSDKHGIPKSEGTAITAISAGGTHTCALTIVGGVKCWGRNEYGQLGDGTKDERLEPTEVKGLAPGVVAISAGYGHTCVLTTKGSVKCWGDNSYGESIRAAGCRTRSKAVAFGPQSALSLRPNKKNHGVADSP